MSGAPQGSHAATQIDPQLLRGWPLPLPGADGDKEQRGRVLVVGGSREMPGAIILAATAALRAGAGKLAIATGASVAQLVALAMPEARVIGLPETAEGGIAPAAFDQLAQPASQADAVLVGPGMQDEPAVCELLLALLGHLEHAKIVLDACAMGVVRLPGYAAARSTAGAQLLLTPHAGEMAHLSGRSKQQVSDDPLDAAARFARQWQATLALKGATTWIACPQGRYWRHDGGNIGLATSGSGDTLAGIIAGLAARGAALEQAAAWGVALHARAGDQLAAQHGPLGYLAREIPAQIPSLMQALGTA